VPAVVVVVLILGIGGVIVAMRSTPSPPPAPPSGPTPPTTDAPAIWSDHAVTGAIGFGTKVGRTADGFVAIAAVADVFTAAWSAEDLEFQVARTEPDDLGAVRITELAIDGSIAVAAGSASSRADARTWYPAVWSSGDAGRSWHRVRNTDAFSAPGEARHIAVAGRHIVVTGEDERAGAVMWTSDDGSTWLRDDAPADKRDHWIDTVARRGDGFVGVMTAPGSIEIRQSVDGITWRPDASLSVCGRAEVDELTVAGAVVVLRGASRCGALEARSTFWSYDGRGAWMDSQIEPAVFGGDGVLATGPLAATTSGFYASVLISVRSDPQHCYQDVTTCKQVQSVLAYSADGHDWRPAGIQLDAAHDSIDATRNRIVQLAAGDHDVAVFEETTPASGVTVARRAALLPGPIPREVTSTTSPPTTAPAYPLVPDGNALVPRRPPDLEVGQTWRFPYQMPGGLTPCQDAIPDFNRRNWRRVEARVSPPYPETWPVLREQGTDTSLTTVFATIVLVDPDRIEVGVEGFGTVWVFVPADSDPDHCGETPPYE